MVLNLWALLQEVHMDFLEEMHGNPISSLKAPWMPECMRGICTTAQAVFLEEVSTILAEVDITQFGFVRQFRFQTAGLVFLQKVIYGLLTVKVTFSARY